VVSERWSTSEQWGIYPVVGECNISRMVNQMSRAVVGTNLDAFFLVGTPEGACLCSSTQDYRRSHAKISNSCDNSNCQHVKGCSRECRAGHHCLPYNGWRQIQTPIVTIRGKWFDHLIACAT
jgi:hypothetical protein